MAIRPLTGDDVDVYRTIRLRALSSDPEAFGSNHAREAEFDDETWRSRIAGFAGRRGQIYVDEIDGTTQGVVGIGFSEQPSDCVLWGMWIDPAARGTGVSSRLVEQAIEWAHQHRCATVTLWVMRTNDVARRLYERHGFVELEGVGKNVPDGCSDEVRMRRVSTRSG